MIVWCIKPELSIISDIEPKTTVRKPLPCDSQAERESKEKYPYLNKKDVNFSINYLGVDFLIDIPKGYCWNGADIPACFWWFIGSKDASQFLNASMVHDRIMERKCLVAYDRQLSSIIFRELLIASGVGKYKAKLMYKAVDFYQKYFCDWKQ